MSPSARVRIARKVVSSYLGAQGLVDATFTVSRSGYDVRVLLPEAGACGPPGAIAAERTFIPLLRSAIGFARSVTVQTTRSHEEISRYRAATCARTAKPIYQENGTGPFLSPSLTLRGGPWVLIFANHDRSKRLDVVVENGRLQAVAPIALTSRGITSRGLVGNAQIRLRVRGAGVWTIALLKGAPQTHQQALTPGYAAAPKGRPAAP
jgi:hypothetical protein